MRDDVFKKIMKILQSVTQESVPHSRRSMEILHKAYPMIPELTLESIYTLYYQRRMRVRHFKCKEMTEELYRRYNAAVANGESEILLRMSLEFDLAPALLARLILDQHFKNDNKCHRCKLMLYETNIRRQECKPCNTLPESFASWSLCERGKSSDNTVSVVSEDVCAEECAKESKLLDDVLLLGSGSPEAYKNNAVVPAELGCERDVCATSENGKMEPRKGRRVRVLGCASNESALDLRSGEALDERFVVAGHVTSLSNGCPGKPAYEITRHRDVSSKQGDLMYMSKITADTQILQDVSSIDQKMKCMRIHNIKQDTKKRIVNESGESCKFPMPGISKAITSVTTECCSNGLLEESSKIEETFREELQELKNKLVQLNLETKMLKTDWPTGADEAGLEFSGMKRSISRLMKDTTLIRDKTLAHEVSMCVLYDDQYGPAATTYKHSLGQEYEVKLIKHAKAADLTFHQEARLRERGFDKTPDLLLIYPIAIGCNVINWIESKALFADREVHNMYFVHQYERYCSRYGPGLVIYWFGFVESLREDDPCILVRENFPKYIKHMNLLVNDASDCETVEDNVATSDWEVAEPSSEEMTKFLERFSS